MKKILTITILSAALLANSLLSRGAELGDCRELVPEGGGISETCRTTEMQEVIKMTRADGDEKPTCTVILQGECEKLANDLDEFYDSIKAGRVHTLPFKPDMSLDDVREFVKKHGKLNCTEIVPEGADQSEICMGTELYQPMVIERKEVRTWEL